MAEDDSNALVPDDRSAAPERRPEHGGDLAVSGREVYLPCSGKVSPGDARFEEIVREILPPECADSLSEEALGRSRRYSAAAVLLILFFIGVSAVVFWWLLPRPVALKRTDVRIPPPERRTYSGRFSAEFKNAQEQIEKRQYIAAKQTLKPLVKELSEQVPPEAGADLIFYSYFALLLDHLDWDADDYKLLGKLREAYPDEFRWQLFHILNSPALERRDGHFQTPGHKLTCHSSQIFSRMKIIDDLRRRHHQDRELVELLDLCKCHLLLYRWRLKNHPKPDDRYGQEDREEAWRIARRYRGNEDFINVRRYLIKQMLRDGTSGYYIFGGKKYFRETHLEKALAALEIEAREGGKRK